MNDISIVFDNGTRRDATSKTSRELAAMVVKYLDMTFEGVAMSDAETIEVLTAAEVLEARLEKAGFPE